MCHIFLNLALKEVSCQLYAPVVLLLENSAIYLLSRKLGGHKNQYRCCRKEKLPATVRK